MTAERSKQYEQNRRKKQDRLEREKQDLAEQEARRQFQLRQEYEAIRAAALAEAARQGAEMERLAKEREQEYEMMRRQQERESERLERERHQKEKVENGRQRLEEERSTAEALEAMRPRSFEGEWKSNVEEVKDAGLRGNRRELAERIKKAGAVHGAWTHAGVTEAEPEEEEGQEEPKKSRVCPVSFFSSRIPPYLPVRRSDVTCRLSMTERSEAKRKSTTTYSALRGNDLARNSSSLHLTTIPVSYFAW